MGVSWGVVLGFDFFLAKALVAGDVEVSSGVCVADMGSGEWTDVCTDAETGSQERHSLSPLFSGSLQSSLRLLWDDQKF